MTVASSSRDTWAADAAPPSQIGLEWQATAAYHPGDVVEYDGALYQATTVPSNTGETPGPSSAYWTPFNPASGAPGASGTLAQVTPVVNCIVQQAAAPGFSAPGFTAVFGYVNSGTSEVIAPISAISPGVNEIIGTPSPAEGEGQPIAFEPGQHDAAFAVDSPDGTTLTWVLGTQSVVASESTPVCSTTMGADGPVATIGGSSILVSPDPSAVLTAAFPAPAASTTVGTAPGAFQVGADGSATYSMPLWTPPALMGIGPSLALSYSSNAGRGTLGMGWNVTGFGISRITRCQKTLAEDGDATPITWIDGADAFCLDGQRLLPTGQASANGQPILQPEHDPFTRVQVLSATGPSTGGFEVDLRDGRVLTYGTTPDSQQTGTLYIWSTGPTRHQPPPSTYAWGLDSVRDPSGNGMSVLYESFTDDGEALAPAPCTELLPAWILYTSGPSQQPERGVGFTYEKPTFSEPSCRYVAGFGLGSEALIQTITMYGPTVSNAANALRTYTMTYVESAATNRSLLGTVTECAGALCKPPTTFNYNDALYATGPTVVGQRYRGGWFQGATGALASLTTMPSVFTDPVVVQFADLNQDGKDDVIFQANSATVAGQIVEGYALSEGTALGPPQILTATTATQIPSGTERVRRIRSERCFPSVRHSRPARRRSSVPIQVSRYAPTVGPRRDAPVAPCTLAGTIAGRRLRGSSARSNTLARCRPAR